MFNRLLKIDPNSPNSFFLFGPRGTGKTAWVKVHFKDALYIDLLDTSLFTQLTAVPHSIERIIPKNHSNWIIIDEIQKVPQLLNEVHRLIENKNLKFVLTGSSARQLRKKGVNLLAGRAHTYYMHSLTCQELGKAFELTNALRFGTLPGLWHTDNPKSFLKSYVHTYVREEVLQEGLTRNIGAFHRFLEVASFSQGAILNMNNIAREAMISRKMVESYFSILEDLLLGFYLQPFMRRATRKITTHPKFYFSDTGVFQILRPRGPLDIDPEINGAALETLFIQEIRALNDYLQLGFQLYFWRTAVKEEVDLILYGEKGLFAFEIKYSKNVSKQDLKGLRAFSQEYPEAICYLLHLGERTEYLENITIIPYTDCLQTILNIFDETRI